MLKEVISCRKALKFTCKESAILNTYPGVMPPDPREGGMGEGSGEGRERKSFALEREEKSRHLHGLVVFV